MPPILISNNSNPSKHQFSNLKSNKLRLNYKLLKKSLASIYVYETGRRNKIKKKIISHQKYPNKSIQNLKMKPTILEPTIHSIRI